MVAFRAPAVSCSSESRRSAAVRRSGVWGYGIGSGRFAENALEFVEGDFIRAQLALDRLAGRRSRGERRADFGGVGVRNAGERMDQIFIAAARLALGALKRD